MIRADVEIILKIQGPILSQSSDPGDPGYDLVAARTLGGPYIPGTLISGKLDQAWQEIADAVGEESDFKPQIEQWLGAKNENQLRGAKQLFFSDFVLRGEEHRSDFYRITVDNELGAVKKHHLLRLESLFESGREYDFVGNLTLFSDTDDVDEICHYVERGLRWVDQFGAMRTIGFGRLQQVKLKKNVKRISSTGGNAHLDETGIAEVLITPDHQFCIAGKPQDENLFESQEIIPGAAIIGSLATTWSHMAGDSNGSLCNVNDKERKELKDNFNKIRITHAFPATENASRPVTFPFSVVKTDKESFYDVATLSGPCLINNNVPDFAVDWKSDDDVKQYFGWSQPERELRVRTAISPDTLRAADKELFAYELVMPKGHSWYARLDLSRVDSSCRQDVFKQLESLVSFGVSGLGKTKTPFKIKFDTTHAIRSAHPSNSTPINGKQWVVTLQTDTLLGVPEKITENGRQEKMFEMYRMAWEDLSKNLKLIRYFARQKFAGGKYLYHVFGKRKPTGMYMPWLLTEAGSVFVLEACDDPEAAREDVERWLLQGLPLGKSVKEYYQIDADPDLQWRACPYLPQNGYGEIAVNLSVHTAKAPGINAITEIENLKTEEDV